MDETNSRTLSISLFGRHDSVWPKPKHWTWDELSNHLNLHWPCATKETISLWSPAQYKNRSPRSKHNVLYLHLLVLDFDKGTEWTAHRTAWADCEFLVHTTYSHTEGYPKWRAIFPLQVPVPPEDWERLYWNAAHALGCQAMDSVCRDVSRMYYLPSCPGDRVKESRIWAHPGEWINLYDFPDIDKKQREEFERATKTDREGRTMGWTGKIDYGAIAKANIPYGSRHDILVKAIRRARAENWPVSAIQHIVTQFHRNESRDFGKRSNEESLNCYLHEIDSAWQKFQPDPKFIEDGK